MKTKPIATFGQWNVYREYIVCERAGYDLTLAELSRDFDWTSHMASKTWCDLMDFCRARQRLFAIQVKEAA